MDNSEKYTDDEIIRGCQKKKRKYQEILYQKFAKKMYSICLSYASDRHAAKDILQEGFIKVFKHISDFEPTGSLGGWIRRIITNTAIDHYRKKARLSHFIDQEFASPAAFDQKALDILHTEDIIEKIRKLPEGARIIFNLFALEGYTHKEIAQKLNISEGTSKSQYARARALLQKELSDYQTLKPKKS